MLILKNILVTFCLLGILLHAVPIAYEVRQFTRKVVGRLAESANDGRALLPNYGSEGWAVKHFLEFSTLQVQYFDYIGWRRKPFRGETININEDGYRLTTSPKTPPKATAWFFGGSAMWGTGARDFETIPSNFSTLSQFESTNFGESGWVAHQSLNLLTRLYTQGYRSDLVVFYDGANDVAHKCRRHANVFSTVEEPRIRSTLEKYAGSQYSMTNLYAPLFSALTRLWSVESSIDPPSSDQYDCASNETKAELVANSLVEDWKLAKLYVESNGGRFLPVLQPVAFVGAPVTSHLVLRDDLGKQYRTVYLKISRKLESAGIEFVDGTEALDGKEFLYIDFCHASPKANARIAKLIYTHLLGKRRAPYSIEAQ